MAQGVQNVNNKNGRPVVRGNILSPLIGLLLFKLTFYNKNMQMINPDNAEEVEQDAAAFLRERFLKLIGSKLAGRECTIEMFENTTVNCKIKSMDPKFANVIVEDLKTPLPAVIKCAKLRTNDMLSLHLLNT